MRRMLFNWGHHYKGIVKAFVLNCNFVKKNDFAGDGKLVARARLMPHFFQICENIMDDIQPPW